MPYNDLGYAYKSCVLGWTKSAAECYKNGLMCFKCQSIPEDLKEKCKMKPVVLELVRLYGRPIKGVGWEEKEAGLIIVKLTYALTTIQYICETLKQHNKKKIDIDAILRITKTVLESEEQ